MKTYCVITRDREECVIVETCKLSYFNAKNKLRAVTDDIDFEGLNGSFCIKHGDTLLDNLEIIDQDDDLTALKKRQVCKTKRIRILKNANSPKNSTPNKEKTADRKTKNHLKSSAATKTAKVNKVNTQKSGKYYRNLLPNYQNQDVQNDIQSSEDLETIMSEQEPNEYENLEDRVENVNDNDGNGLGMPDDNSSENDNDKSNGDDSDDPVTPRRPFQNLTNNTRITQTEKKGEEVGRNQINNQQFITWRSGIEKTLTTLTKDVKNLTRVCNSANRQGSAEEPDNGILERQYPESAEKITIENDIEYTEINGLRFDPDEYSSALLATTMKSRAGRVMNVLWTKDEMKNKYLLKAKAVGNFSKVSKADITKIKRICMHMQKKYKIKYSAGSVDDIDIHLRRWISSKLTEKKRECRIIRQP
ncbi:uncharacterized protein LOC141527180 [Cotesia typhae]|uniref:uncharacterized protein LOC141527180 n=1 Tax=Cotesia typhae TaxID=2053667 RepID=UPI003D68533C